MSLYMQTIVRRGGQPDGTDLELARYTAHRGWVEIDEVRTIEPTPQERDEMFHAHCAAVRRSLAHMLEVTA